MKALGPFVRSPRAAAWKSALGHRKARKNQNVQEFPHTRRGELRFHVSARECRAAQDNSVFVCHKTLSQQEPPT